MFAEDISELGTGYNKGLQTNGLSISDTGAGSEREIRIGKRLLSMTGADFARVTRDNSKRPAESFRI